MLLKVLHDFAQNNDLMESIETIERRLDLALNLDDEGKVREDAPWWRFHSEVPDPKLKERPKTVSYRFEQMPAFPGEKNGPVASFLADPCHAVLGLDPASGEPVPDDPKSGKFPTKAFLHFWSQIASAVKEVPLPFLHALVQFHDRYLKTEELRRAFPFVEMRPLGKKNAPTLCAMTRDGEPVPLESKILTFRHRGKVVFEDSRIRDYWKRVYRETLFGAAENGEEPSRGGPCLLTGEVGLPIAGSHKPEIKGVPGLPPKGGYLVSFAREAPALASYGFEGTANAPISKTAAAMYAVGLNSLLANRNSSRPINNQFIVCSWLKDDAEQTALINHTLFEPTPDAVLKLFESLGNKGERYHALDPAHFYSMTLAANGGRIVVRRWLDEPLPVLRANLDLWFEDLFIAQVESSPDQKGSKERNSGRGKTRVRGKVATERDPPNTGAEDLPGETKTVFPYRSIASLAMCTSRTGKDVRPDVYDTLYRAALENAVPEMLLAPSLHRIRVAAVQSGGSLRYHRSRFALLRLTLNRINRNIPESQRAMNIEPQLCETHDRAYNCGRLLAVLDNLQFTSSRADDGQGVGADIIARFYGRASTVPEQVLPSLIQLAQSHLKKLERAKKGGLAFYFDQEIAKILSLFKGDDDEAPSFPGLLSTREQGRFALGFYQQKAYRAPSKEGEDDVSAKNETEQ